MSKDYTVSKVKNMRLIITIATANDPVKDNGKYYAMKQQLQCVANDGQIQIAVSIATKYYGTAKSVPWTDKEVGDAINGYSTFNTVVYNDLKQIFLDAVNEDITQ